jgi:hypothetical protein
MNPDNIQHVYPINDIEPHVLECEHLDSEYPSCPCKCRPEHVETGNVIEGVTGLIIVHNSFDGREGVEWVNDILNN